MPVLNVTDLEELGQTLFEESGDALFLFDPESEQMVDANPAAQRLSGFSRQELLARPVSFLFRSETPGGLQRLRQAIRRTGPFSSQEGYLLRHEQDGQWVPVNLTLTRLHMRPRILGLITARDVSDRLREQERLQRAEAELRRVLNSVSDCIWSGEFDRHGRWHYRFASPVIELITGRPSDYYRGGLECWLKTIHPEDRPRIEQGLQTRVAEQQRHSEQEYRVIWPDGTVRWVRDSIMATPGPDGRSLRLDGILTDITERRRMDEALRAGEAKYRALIENLSQSVFLKDRDLRFVAANRPFCEALGVAEADLVGKTDLDFYPPHLADKYRADDRLVLTEDRRVEVEEENVINGRSCVVRVVKTPVKDDQGNTVGVLGIFWDVTQQRALEAQLRQAGKLEAVGQLAGGVAHDFNNLLTAILGNLSLISANLSTADPNQELLATAEKAALRAATLTSQLLGFSRKTLLRPQPTNLNLISDEVVGILRRTIDPRIAVEVRRAADLGLVHADASQLTQVLLNLCLNARDAMPNGGRLLLETDNVVLDEEYARFHLEARPGRFVRLRVSDTGCGIPPEIRGRIFEPFFTTKELGKGTGLGLAMVFGIVSQHQGWIHCYSEAGQGTCFHIYLPRFDGEAVSSVRAVTPPCHGHETVLVADDEPMIRNLAKAILQRYGYQVLLAEDGAEAVELYQRERSRIDLVILDLTMPRLSGRDACRRLLEINPQARILFASGYSADQVQCEGAVLGFVAKPYRPEELAGTIRTVLDRDRRLQGAGI